MLLKNDYSTPSKQQASHLSNVKAKEGRVQRMLSPVRNNVERRDVERSEREGKGETARSFLELSDANSARDWHWSPAGKKRSRTLARARIQFGRRRACTGNLNVTAESSGRDAATFRAMRVFFQTSSNDARARAHLSRWWLSTTRDTAGHTLARCPTRPVTASRIRAPGSRGQRGARYASSCADACMRARVCVSRVAGRPSAKDSPVAATACNFPERLRRWARPRACVYRCSKPRSGDRPTDRTNDRPTNPTVPVKGDCDYFTSSAAPSREWGRSSDPRFVSLALSPMARALLPPRPRKCNARPATSSTTVAVGTAAASRASRQTAPPHGRAEEASDGQGRRSAAPTWSPRYVFTWFRYPAISRCHRERSSGIEAYL